MSNVRLQVSSSWTNRLRKTDENNIWNKLGYTKGNAASMLSSLPSEERLEDIFIYIEL